MVPLRLRFTTNRLLIIINSFCILLTLKIKGCYIHVFSDVTFGELRHGGCTNELDSDTHT